MIHNKCPHCGHYENIKFATCPVCNKSTEDGKCPICYGSGQEVVSPAEGCDPPILRTCVICGGTGEKQTRN